ncbi:hypothetical protein AB0D71_35705 [Streptomyces avermitilis]|uniref:hypothetical protein n=1 Tax=Streptomyces avermitilis TaxID=33903 RepID=UPI0033DCC762
MRKSPAEADAESDGTGGSVAVAVAVAEAETGAPKAGPPANGTMSTPTARAVTAPLRSRTVEGVMG